MTGKWAARLTVVLAFAAGIAVGIICGRDCSDRCAAHGRSATVGGALRAPRNPDSDHSNADCRFEGRAVAPRPPKPSPTDEAERVPPETTVEVTYADASEEPSPDITAAHRARQAKRAAAREAKAGKRRDFFSKLNLDLLTVAQQELHAEYAEAVTVRDMARCEIRDLRAKGEEVPTELTKRLADAETVIRADAAEEHRALRAAAARAHGLDDAGVEALLEDLASIDSAMGVARP